MKSQRLKVVSILKGRQKSIEREHPKKSSDSIYTSFNVSEIPSLQQHEKIQNFLRFKSLRLSLNYGDKRNRFESKTHHNEHDHY